MEMRRSQSGFTLMELVVAMGATLAIFSAGMILYTKGLTSSAQNTAQTMATGQARSIQYLIDKDIKQASVIPTTVTIPQGTFTPSGTVLVLKQPSWDATNSQTLANKFDIVVYQFVTTQVSGSVTHKCYNMRRIVSPDASSSRIAEDRWLLPYDANRDASDVTLRRSEPWIDLTSGYANIFTYYVQNSASPGQVKTRISETFDNVPLVEMDYTVFRTYDQSFMSTDVATRSRLRNWSPPGS